MKIEDIKVVAVLGANGAMGQQIGMNVALAGRAYGYKVVMYGRRPEAMEKTHAWADKYLAGRVEKGRITQEEADKVFANISYSTDLEQAVKDADLVIEAVKEDLQIKRSVLGAASKLVKADTIIGTNSSNICSSKLADVVVNPERLLNMHYFNPALVMKLVELVRNPHTNDETVETAKAFCLNTDKSPITINKEISGFVANRINAAVTREACNLLEKGIASIEDIDTACEKGLGYPMGPFKLMDMTGLDVNYYVRRDRFAESGDPNDMPSFCVVDKVIKGEYGRKTGKGWYEYPAKK